MMQQSPPSALRHMISMEGQRRVSVRRRHRIQYVHMWLDWVPGGREWQRQWTDRGVVSPQATTSRVIWSLS